MLLAGVMVVAGLAMTGLSVAKINTSKPHPQMAQATPPLQSTPGAENKPSAPSEPTTTGARPTAVPPEPARPDAEAQKAGAQQRCRPLPPKRSPRRSRSGSGFHSPHLTRS